MVFPYSGTFGIVFWGLRGVGYQHLLLEFRSAMKYRKANSYQDRSNDKKQAFRNKSVFGIILLITPATRLNRYAKANADGENCC